MSGALGAARSTPRASRRVLVAIVASVSLLHAAGWWVWRAGASHTAHSEAPIATGWQVRMLSGPARRDASEAALLPRGAPMPEAPHDRPPAATPFDAVPPTGWRPTAFRPADELDVAPTPEEGWWLDEALLQQQGRARLTVALWVSAEGRIVQWRLLHAEPPGAWAAQALARLPDTPLRPAQWHGQPQAAHLVIEIASDDESYR